MVGSVDSVISRPSFWLDLFHNYFIFFNWSNCKSRFYFHDTSISVMICEQ